jgi:organic hydroperoxide reductase OsmC/OhrA
VSREHRYLVEVEWTGNRGPGTRDYRAYERAHAVRAQRKPTILASSEPALRGDGARWNPEELLVSALSQCHMLWYLHLCATSGVVVASYVDRAEGVMVETDDGSGHFTQVNLRPVAGLADLDRLDQARKLHQDAHRSCFVANSVNFKVTVAPSFEDAPCI